MKTKQEVKKKIESILNRYYKETGKEIISPIEVFRVLNQKFNFKMEVKFKEQEGLEKENYLKDKNLKRGYKNGKKSS